MNEEQLTLKTKQQYYMQMLIQKPKYMIKTTYDTKALEYYQDEQILTKDNKSNLNSNGDYNLTTIFKPL